MLDQKLNCLLNIAADVPQDTSTGAWIGVKFLHSTVRSPIAGVCPTPLVDELGRLHPVVFRLAVRLGGPPRWLSPCQSAPNFDCPLLLMKLARSRA